MKTILSIIVLLVYMLNSAGQKSYLYNQNGKLRVDTTLSIDLSRITEIKDVEKLVLPTFYNRLKYPEICIENGVEGLVIIKVSTINSKNDANIKVVKGFDPNIDIAVSDAFGQIKKGLLETLKFENLKDIEFYLPILFELEKPSFENDLKNEGVVKKKSTTYTAQRNRVTSPANNRVASPTSKN